MKIEPLGTHSYQGDQTYDQFGEDRCVVCKLGRESGRAKGAHDAAEIAAAEEQLLGERIVGEGGAE